MPRFWRRPLDLDRMTVPRGEVRIIVERCKGCAFCVEYCPKGVLAISKSHNAKGYHPPEVVRPGECVDCNLCEMICPDFAIYSVPLPPAPARVGSQERTGEP
jgi:2-oxoglutarate ferredoxin oxidoreductase subunit delta